MKCCLVLAVLDARTLTACLRGCSLAWHTADAFLGEKKERKTKISKVEKREREKKKKQWRAGVSPNPRINNVLSARRKPPRLVWSKEKEKKRTLGSLNFGMAGQRERRERWRGENCGVIRA